MTNIVVAIAAGILGLAGLKELPILDFFIGLLIILLGLFGALALLKHYERFMYHTQWAQEYDKK